MKSTRLIIAALPWVIACASASTATPSESTGERVLATTETGIVRSHEASGADSIIKAPPAQVFSALRAAYADLGIDIGLLNPTSLEVGNRRFSKMYEIAGVKMSKYVGCGSAETGPAADNYRVTMSLISQVSPADSGARVSTTMTAYAEDLASSKGKLSCMSLGALEQRINSLTAEHVH
jgi:hypothetical protein